MSKRNNTTHPAWGLALIPITLAVLAALALIGRIFGDAPQPSTCAPTSTASAPACNQPGEQK